MATWTCPACAGENPEGTRFCGHCGAKAADTAPPPPDQDIAEALRSFVAGPVADRLVEARGHLPEERRLITALFADVSGFTSLAERLDPEQLLEVIDPVIGALSSIVGRYGGYVEKFAGDALLALFGAPVTHEDDPERALLVALEMHAELERLCATLPHDPELRLHVGVNSGHGIARILGSEARMDYAVLGDSVILAQRLESAAPSGETYVSETTARLVRDRFELEPVGELTLKGKSEPVMAWRLLGVRREPAARSQAPLVGREPELAAILEALDSLADGRGAVVAVTGEPGVGKSRLTAAVRERAARVQWLQARCLSYGAGIAYWPYADLLRRSSEDEGLAGALDRVGVPEALPLFSRLLGLPTDAPALEPEAFRRALHQAFAAWLRSLARDRPVVLVLEDVHWADASSLALTEELARACADVPVGLLLVARPEAASILRDIAPGTRAVDLRPLDEAAVETLMVGLLGASPPRGLAAFVANRTGGNPLFVEEVLRSLLDGGAIAREDDRWSLRPGWDARALPETLEEVLSARIDLLPRSAAEVLQTAAVIGRRVRLPLLAAVADLSDVDRHVEELVGRGFLEQADGAVSFRHALIQDAAYERLLRRRRRELHRRVADVAEALYGAEDQTIDLLARHLYLGGGGPKAVEYLLRAGERAKRLFANEEAILHFRRALELAPDDPEVELELGDLHELVGEYDEALQLYAKVRDTDGDVRAWRGIAATLRKTGEFDGALRAVDEAFASEPLRGADLTPLWLEQGWTLTGAGRLGQAIDVVQAGLETVHPRRDPAVARLLLLLAFAKNAAGERREALAHAHEATAIFEESDDPRGLATALRITGDVAREAQRLDEAAAALRRGLELAERAGSVEEVGGCLINLGLVEFDRGRFADAIASYGRAIAEFERIGHGSGQAIGYGNLAFALANAGRYEDAWSVAQKALEFSRSIAHARTVAETIDTMAFIALSTGRAAEAGERAEEAAELFDAMGARLRAVEALSTAAEAWARAGDQSRARAVEARARELEAAI